LKNRNLRWNGEITDERKSREINGGHFIMAGNGERKSIILLLSSQASPTRPSDNGSMKVKTPQLLDVVT
jgi:hypothetical protein